MKIDTFALTEHMTTDSDMDSKHSATDDLDITDLEIADLDLAENQHESNQNHRMIDADNHGINHHERNTALQGNLARSQAIPKSIQEAQSQHKSLAQTTTPPATNQMSLTQKNNMNKMLESHTAVTQKTTPMKTMLPESGFLRVDQLRRTANLAELPPSTRRIKPLNDFLGQHRARAAVETALSLPFDGYNIFAVGTSGLGKRTMLKRMLAVQAAEMPTPSDWVYVNNFANPRQPTALELPPSDAPKLKKLVHQLWNTIFDQLEKTFAADSYHTRIENIRQSAGNAQQLALQALTQEGEALALKLVSRNEEHRFVPVKLQPIEDPNAAENALASKELDQNELAALAPAERAKINHNVRSMDKKLHRLGARLGRIEEQTRHQVAKLNAQIASDVVIPRVTQVAQRFEHVNGITEYLKDYATDIIEHVELILEQEEDDFLPGIFDRVPQRYQVNVVVTHKPNSGAPVIFEDLPTHYNLLGHVEQLTQMGTITTDFTLIRSGALHRANGGFLLLEADQLLEQPYAWQGLKRALRSGQLKLSSLEHMLTLTGSISLEPDSLPLSVKVILLGEPNIYYELLEFEPDLNSLFKIRADFTNTLNRTVENEEAYVRLIADYVNKDKLLPFDRSALAALLTDSSRQAEDQSSLSLHAATLGDLLREASTLAIQQDDRQVTAKHIDATLAARLYRLGHLRELYWEDLSRGTQLIETEGFRIGQINALTVVHYADSEFGLPARLTATVYQGSGEILDIERSVELGGALHAKGILIMSSFLRAHFGRTQPIHFSAALAFEQSYGEIDGDSATLAELCALISSISQIPIDQSWAMTGSMNQLGVVQPIGGINPKIEGFFDACQLQGLNGNQGVILPIQNVQHLMLRQDVIDAVSEGKFHLYAVRTVEEALSLLMKRPAGIMNPKGRYEKDTIFGQVMSQLKHWQQLEEGDRSKTDAPQKKKSGKVKNKAKTKSEKTDDTSSDKDKPNIKKKPKIDKVDKKKDEKSQPTKVRKVPRRDPEDHNDEESRIEWAGE
jgi:lon-related putative ATP-dependent protease